MGKFSDPWKWKFISVTWNMKYENELNSYFIHFFLEKSFSETMIYKINSFKSVHKLTRWYPCIPVSAHWERVGIDFLDLTRYANKKYLIFSAQIYKKCSENIFKKTKYISWSQTYFHMKHMYLFIFIYFRCYCFLVDKYLFYREKRAFILALSNNI